MKKSNIGHNSVRLDQDARNAMKSAIKRIEKLSEEKQAIADDIADIYRELKSSGFDTKAMRALVSARKKKRDNEAKYEEETAIRDLYFEAFGL